MTRELSADRVGTTVSFVAVAVTVLAAAGCGGTPWSGEGDRPLATVTAQKTSAEFKVPAKGYLEALSASPIAVPRVPTGALQVKDLVPEGSIVEPGQVVVVFDDTQLNIELGNHKASFRSTDRRIEGNDLQSLIESGAIEVMRRVAELELDNAESFGNLDGAIYSRLEILESEVKKDEAEETILFADASLLLRGEYYDIEERILGVEKDQVEGKISRVETSLGSLVLKSPIGGLIVYKKNWRGSSVAVGDTLWPGNVIMSIVDPDSAALTAFVLEKDSAGVEEGARATVVIDAQADREFQGKVTSVVEVSRPIERGSPVKYAEVRIELELDEPGLLKPGMKGEARIVTGRVDETVVLPRSALRGSPERPFVLLQGPDGPERRAVTTGLGDLVRVSIEDGLEGGESILLGGEAPDPPQEQEQPAVEQLAAGSGAEA